MNSKPFLVGGVLLGLAFLSGCIGPAAETASGDDVTPAGGQDEGAGGGGSAPNESVPEWQRPTGVAENGAAYRERNLSGHVLVDGAAFGISSVTDTYPSMSVGVEKDAKGIVAEFFVDGPVSRFRLLVSSPVYCDDDVAGLVCSPMTFLLGEGTGTHRADGDVGQTHIRVAIDADTIELESVCPATACDWVVTAMVDAAADVDWRLHAAVFPDQAPPDGFGFGQA
jgi:hypothetical protein